MASFKFSSLYLFIILFVVLVISVILGYHMNMIEGMTSPTSSAPSSSSSTLTPVAFIPYKSTTLYSIYNGTGTPNNLIMLFDTVNGNMIVTDSMTPTTNFVMVDRYGETNEYSPATVITPTSQALPPNAKNGWTYQNQQVTVCNVSVNMFTYLYIFDNSSSSSTITIYRSNASSIVQELATTALTSPNIQNLNLSDSTPQSLENSIGKMSNSDLKVSVGSSSVISTNNYYVIVSIPPNNSNKAIVIVDKNTYELVSVTRTDSTVPSSSNTPVSGMAPGSSVGMTPMPSNLGSLDTLIYALADIAGSYGNNLRGQGHAPSTYHNLSNFEKNNSGLGCGFNPADSNYILKSEIVPPVCPQCPSCGTSGCPLSINSSGQIVDCNGNVISNFGSTPSSDSESSSSSSYTPSTISGSISGTIDNTVSTAGNVADTAITSTTGAVSDIAGTAGSTVSNVAGSAGSTVSNVAGSAGGAVSSLGKDVSNIVGGLGKDATTIGVAAIGATSGVANNAINSTTSLVGGLGATAPAAATTAATVPYAYYGYPSYGYVNYPYMGYGGYQGPSTCSQQSTYLPITNDFSAFGR